MTLQFKKRISVGAEIKGDFIRRSKKAFALTKSEKKEVAKVKRKLKKLKPTKKKITKLGKKIDFGRLL